MYQLAKYATATTIYFSMIKAGSNDLAQTADWTPATGDTKVSINGATLANTTNNPAIVAGTNGVLWSLALTTGELTGADIRVQIVDSATKAVEDQSLTVYTYGNASAKFVSDFSVAALGALMPTTAGRTLDVTTTGEAGLDFANVNLPVGSIPIVNIIENGTMQAGSAAGTAVLRSATSFVDDLIIGATIIVTGGTGAGQSRIIYDWVSTTDTASISPNWTTTPDNTSTYLVVPTPPASTNSATLPAVNLTSWNGTAVATPDTAGYPKVTIKDGTGAGEIALTSGAIDTVAAVTTVNGLAANVITAAATAADFTTEVASGLPTLTQLNTTRYLKNTASQKVYFTLVDSTDHVTRKTGITVTAQRSLDGAAFGSATGTVTEVGNGVYYHSTSTADINADDVVFRFTGTACDPVELHIVTAS